MSTTPNSTDISSKCQSIEAPSSNAPTTTAFCSMINVGNNSEIMQSCCEENVSSFDDLTLNAPPCFLYCNVSSDAWKPESENSVGKCLSDRNQSAAAVVCGSGKDGEEDKESSAMRVPGRKGVRGGWMVLVSGYLMMSLMMGS